MSSCCPGAVAIEKLYGANHTFQCCCLIQISNWQGKATQTLRHHHLMTLSVRYADPSVQIQLTASRSFVYGSSTRGSHSEVHDPWRPSGYTQRCSASRNRKLS